VLTITFRRDSRQRLSSVLAEGHADTAVHGEDLVCAAASAILQAAEVGLSGYAELPPGTTVRGDSGYMTITIDRADRDREDVMAILATAELAIAALAKQFPDAIAYVCEDEPRGS
jgi:uncharacterized protein YsxB (DUF464 family)